MSQTDSNVENRQGTTPQTGQLPPLGSQWINPAFDGLLRIFEKASSVVHARLPAEDRGNLLRTNLWLVLESARSFGMIEFDQEKMQTLCRPIPEVVKTEEGTFAATKVSDVRG